MIINNNTNNNTNNNKIIILEHLQQNLQKCIFKQHNIIKNDFFLKVYFTTIYKTFWIL